jgi:hypothetical protein
MNANDKGNTARVINAVLGVWLLVSVFVWRHSLVQQTNVWVTGVLAVAFAFIAYAFEPKVRYLNALLALWLFGSSLALSPTTRATMWNGLIVSLLMLAASLTPGGGSRSTTGRPPRAVA